MKIGILDKLLEFYSHIIKNFSLNIQALEKLGNFLFLILFKLKYMYKRSNIAKLPLTVINVSKLIHTNIDFIIIKVGYLYLLYSANLLYTQLDNANEALECYD